MIRFTSLSAAAIAAVVAATPVQAEQLQISFQYNPAELATTDGASTVYKRLRLSAKRACEVPSPIQKRQQFECRRDIENDLVAQVGSPILLAMHRDAQHPARVAKTD